MVSKKIYDENTGARFRYQTIDNDDTLYAAKTVRNGDYAEDAWLTYTVRITDLLEAENDSFWQILGSEVQE